ncbi:MAG: mannose-1-phosphate guanylyltransferase [Dictyoglomus sp.]|nr:mannose-1-phosphate guanylyltransferase [Dictyoglomus sp.]MCX7845681.1 mannose-1-phosphate guanylyltransferase [Dictyoglomaceae bacterium]MDW8188483.1 mannose-1-phosphate guanylyltransferase [Dictyoglomus sp.]
MKVRVVIIAGGSGKRLWPISTEYKPKPFLNLFGEENLIKNTFERAKRISKDISMVVNIKHKRYVEDLPAEKIYEIIGRNTAPAIALASLFLDDEDIMVVLPADHVIPEIDKFEKIIRKAIDFANRRDALITLGIKPTYPETGYGYIEVGEKVEENIYKVLLFHEKPDLEKAKEYIEKGSFFWNSGIFIWKNKSIKSAFIKYLSEDYGKIYTLKEYIGKESFEEKIEEVYKEIKSVSIDKGVLEKAENIYVIPADFQWSDIGSWESLYNVFPKDKRGNYITGEVKTLDVKNSLILNYSDKETVVIEEENIIVVITEDKILISKKGSSSRVKDII